MEILLVGAAACMVAVILGAWIMTFSRWFPIPGLDGTYDYATFIRAHVDYALMAAFGAAFYAVGASGVDLPIIACWCVAIGGFTNPSIFIVAALDEKFWDKTFWKVFSAASFVTTSVGFIWLACTFVQHYLNA